MFFTLLLNYEIFLKMDSIVDYWVFPPILSLLAAGSVLMYYRIRKKQLKSELKNYLNKKKELDGKLKIINSELDDLRVRLYIEKQEIEQKLKEVKPRNDQQISDEGSRSSSKKIG